MKTKKKKTADIAALLPEGLSEDTVVKISELVDTIITEAVEKKVKQLTTQVTGFLRMHIDDLKEQAVKELEVENPMFRNAKLFEAVRDIMYTEFSVDDEESVVHNMSEDNLSLQQENEVLTTEVGKVLAENEKMRTVIKALDDKVKASETALTEMRASAKDAAKKYKEKVTKLEESSSKPFKSSEKGLVASKENDHLQDPNKEANVITEGNLPPEIMNLMPKS